MHLERAVRFWPPIRTDVGTRRGPTDLRSRPSAPTAEAPEGPGSSRTWTTSEPPDWAAGPSAGEGLGTGDRGHGCRQHLCRPSSCFFSTFPHVPPSLWCRVSRATAGWGHSPRRLTLPCPHPPAREGPRLGSLWAATSEAGPTGAPCWGSASEVVIRDSAGPVLSLLPGWVAVQVLTLVTGFLSPVPTQLLSERWIWCPRQRVTGQ